MRVSSTFLQVKNRELSEKRQLKKWKILPYIQWIGRIATSKTDLVIGLDSSENLEPIRMTYKKKQFKGKYNSQKYSYFHQVGDVRSNVFDQDVVVMLSVVILAQVAVCRWD